MWKLLLIFSATVVKCKFKSMLIIECLIIANLQSCWARRLATISPPPTPVPVTRLRPTVTLTAADWHVVPMGPAVSVTVCVSHPEPKTIISIIIIIIMIISSSSLSSSLSWIPPLESSVTLEAECWPSAVLDWDVSTVVKLGQVWAGAEG